MSLVAGILQNWPKPTCSENNPFLYTPQRDALIRHDGAD